MRRSSAVGLSIHRAEKDYERRHRRGRQEAGGTGPYRMSLGKSSSSSSSRPMTRTGKGPHPEAHRSARHSRGGHAAGRAADGGERLIFGVPSSGQRPWRPTTDQAHVRRVRPPYLVQREEAAFDDGVCAAMNYAVMSESIVNGILKATARCARPLPDPACLARRDRQYKLDVARGRALLKEEGKEGASASRGPAQGLNGQRRGDPEACQPARQGQHQGQSPVSRVSVYRRATGWRVSRWRSSVGKRSRPTASSPGAWLTENSKFYGKPQVTRPSTRPATLAADARALQGFRRLLAEEPGPVTRPSPSCTGRTPVPASLAYAAMRTPHVLCQGLMSGRAPGGAPALPRPAVSDGRLGQLVPTSHLSLIASC